jgi:hypothetical protein
MATSDDLSTLMVLAGVLAQPGAAQHAVHIVADTLSSDWAKQLGETMIKEASATTPAEVLSAHSSSAEPSTEASAARADDLKVVRQLAGLGAA